MDYHVLRCIGCFIAMLVFELVAVGLGADSPGYYILMMMAVAMMVVLVALQRIHGKAKGHEKETKRSFEQISRDRMRDVA